MKFIFALLCLLPILARGQDHLKDGPCPKLSDAVVHKSLDTLTEEEKNHLYTIWYEVAANHDFSNGEKCFSNNYTVAEEKTHFFQNITSEDKDGNVRTKLVKWVLNKEHTIVATYQRDETGEWKADGWHYSIADFKDDVLLVYSCREVEKKHEDLYLIRSKTLSPNEKAVAEFKKKVKETGDDREFINADYKDCKHLN